MPKAKKFLITTTSHEVTQFRSLVRSERSGLCINCDSASLFLDLNEAVDASGKGAFVILDAIRSNLMHVTELDNGHLLICRNSLFEWIKN